MNINDLIRNARFNVLLGKNGSGKSTLLRTLDSSTEFETKYISPERGGTLKYNPNIDQNISDNVNWMIKDRRKNRTENFRQQSTAQFRNLEMMVLREIETDQSKRQDTEYTFDKTLSKINDLLPAIRLRRVDRGFDIVSSKDDEPIAEDQISSGEAELIALAIEVLVFSRSTPQNKVLLLDEPDVHLHPDLQQKFVRFVEKTATEFDFRVAIATHSTAIIGAFAKNADLQIVPMKEKEQTDFEYFNYDPVCHAILPIFGCHPLSSHFNTSPVLLVEGEDDKRVIDQVVRSANKRFSYSPCVVGTVSQMNEWEVWLNKFLPSIYDDPKGYSLRDLDASQQTNIDDIGCVTRTRLNCYSIENLLLTNECLAQHDYTAEQFLEELNQWVKQNPTHQTASQLSILSDKFDERRTISIKEIRNVILALLGTAKPWEVLVGQLIVNNIDSKSTDHDSLYTYMGDNVVNRIFS